MKKTILILTLLAFVITMTNAQFRKTTWGMNKGQVKQKETCTLLKEEPTLLTYSNTLNGMKNYTMYVFKNNKLIQGKYSFHHKHSNKNDFITDYNELKDLLIKKYGTPIKNKITWHNNAHKNDPKMWGQAISFGHLSFYTMWKEEGTNILLTLNGNNYKIIFLLDYNIPTQRGVDKKKKEKEALDAL